MRNVLSIAYRFPPCGGSGVQRPAKFAKYLPEFGYQPLVLTGTVRPRRYSMDRALQDRDPFRRLFMHPPDLGAHGTHVMGIAAGKDIEALKSAGVPDNWRSWCESSLPRRRS